MSSIEINTGLFCASAPTLSPLIRNIAPNPLSSISQTFTGRSTVGQSTATSGYKIKAPIPVLLAKKKAWHKSIISRLVNMGKANQNLIRGGVSGIWTGQEAQVVQHYYQNRNSIQGPEIWVDSEMAIDEGKILKTVSVTVTAEELARNGKGVMKDPNVTWFEDS
jgi:hypothetical protein